MNVSDVDRAFERLPFGTFPTPVHRLDRARAGAELWVKRDDKTGEKCGGNHLRKIEFLLADAKRRGKRRVLTFSCLGSNYAVAMTLYGRQAGFPCDIVMSYKLPNTALRQNLLLTAHFGAKLFYAKTFPGAGLLLAKLYARRSLQDLRAPYFTRAGASAPLGAMGFVRAGLEFAE